MKYRLFLIITGISIIMLGATVASTPKKYHGRLLITTYAPVAAECDSTPDEGAGGIIAVDGKPTGNWFASNSLPFGTKIVIPSVSGRKVWVCRDRMHPRYGDENIDLCYPQDKKPFINAQRHDVYIVETF